jgi:hypothetical protein
LRAFTDAVPDATQVRVHALPAAVCDFVDAFDAVAHLGDGMVAEFGVGLVHMRLRRSDAKRLASLSTRVTRHGARLVVEHAQAGVELPAGEELQPVVAALQRRTKLAFDPQGLLRAAPAALQGTMGSET